MQNSLLLHSILILGLSGQIASLQSAASAATAQPTPSTTWVPFVAHTGFPRPFALHAADGSSMNFLADELAPFGPAIARIYDVGDDKRLKTRSGLFFFKKALPVITSCRRYKSIRKIIRELAKHEDLLACSYEEKIILWKLADDLDIDLLTNAIALALLQQHPNIDLTMLDDMPKQLSKMLEREDWYARGSIYIQPKHFCTDGFLDYHFSPLLYETANNKEQLIQELLRHEDTIKELPACGLKTELIQRMILACGRFHEFNLEYWRSLLPKGFEAVSPIDRPSQNFTLGED